MIEFDYPRWQNEALKYIENPKLLESSDLMILRKLLTLHIRKERFCSGYLAVAINTGHLVKILERLEELKTDMKD
jgi:O-acetyl-ADP-ribose deacetylase